MATIKDDVQEELDFGPQLTCRVCQQQLADPRILPCRHSFCRHCLEMQASAGTVLECQMCDRLYHIPSHGISALPSDVFATSLVELLQTEEHHKQCSKHRELLDVYCTTCQRLACRECTSSDCDGHDYKHFVDLQVRCKQQVQEGLQLLRNKRDAVSDACVSLRHSKREIQEKGESIKQQVHSLFQEMEIAITQQIDDVVGNKLRVLTLQEEDAVAVEAQLQTCEKSVEQVLTAATQHQMLLSKVRLLNAIADVCSQAGVDMFRPFEKADMAVSEKEEQMVDDFKKNTVQFSLLYLKCTAAPVDVPNRIQFGKTMKLELTIQEDDGSPILIPTTLISARLTNDTDLTDHSCRNCDVVELGPGKYQVSYTPLSVGSHVLSVQIGGREIQRSPFEMQVLSSLDFTGQVLRRIQGFSEPWGVAVNGSGEVIVSEYGAHRITILTEECQKARPFNCNSLDFWLCGMAITSDQHLVITNGYSHSIQLVTFEGKLLHSLDKDSHKFLEIGVPIGVTVNRATQQILVTEVANHCVLVFDEDLTFSHSFGSEGSLAGQLYKPWDLACNSRGEVYVADCGNNRVQKFTSSGEFLMEFGAISDTENITTPSGIAIDSKDTVYVTEISAHRVSVFSADGLFVMSFGQEYRKQLQEPCGIAIDEDGHIYVCNQGNGYLIIF